MRTKLGDHVVGPNRFSVEGAREHKKHIVNNVIGRMLASDEINQRLQAYWSSHVLPADDYLIDSDLTDVIDSLDWDDDALEALRTSIPYTFQEVIKKAITKKATQNGVNHITKKVLRQYGPKF